MTFAGVRINDDPLIAAELVAQFCEANHLAEPREGWRNNLVHPTE